MGKEIRGKERPEKENGNEDVRELGRKRRERGGGKKDTSKRVGRGEQIKIQQGGGGNRNRE